MEDYSTFVDAGRDYRQLQAHLQSLAANPKALRRQILTIGEVPLDAQICKTVFSNLASYGTSVLEEAGELLEELINTLFLGLTLIVDGQGKDVSTFVMGLAAGKNPGDTFSLGTPPVEDHHEAS